MKKIKISITALSVLLGAISAIAFSSKSKRHKGTETWFIYTGAYQTPSYYNDPNNYVATFSQPWCDHAGSLCAILVTATAVFGQYPLVPGGSFGAPLGTNLYYVVDHVPDAVVGGANDSYVTEVNKP